MSYITGPITSANPGPALYAAIEPTLLAAGFTLVDTVVIGTITHKILKSAAVGNSFGKDWYLDVWYATTGTGSGFDIRAFEFFDPATNVAYRGPVFSSGPPAADFSFYGATGYPLDTMWANVTAVTLTTGAFTYYLSATLNRVILGLSNQNTRLNYAGFYQPTARFEAQAGAYNYPLCTTYLQGANPWIIFNRVPVLGAPASDWDPEANGPLANAWVGAIRQRATEFDAMGMNFPSTPFNGTYGHHLAWPVEVGAAAIGVMGRLLDVAWTKGNTGGTLVMGDTVTISPNGDLSAGVTYLTTLRNAALYFFRGI